MMMMILIRRRNPRVAMIARTVAATTIGATGNEVLVDTVTTVTTRMPGNAVGSDTESRVEGTSVVIGKNDIVAIDQSPPPGSIINPQSTRKTAADEEKVAMIA
jgi:hypothetical protein